ncbi:MAG: GDP-mannose dehydrogenase [Gammaproteobacteria bacterium]|nr:nucleotide sugar dehydrogenase [Gammaproteobacteria bacterium]PCH63996.1 MAG: GDP-mannose dehydrogenase [Gammaproteobacteria bacterium]
MNISVLGLGYVGAVSAACLAKEGHKIIGVDPNCTKVDLINSGNTPIVERQIAEIIQEAVKNELLSATTDIAQAIAETDVSIVCVGTPSNANGSLDLRYVKKVCEEIGQAIKAKSSRHVIVMRSTMLPGSMKDLVIPTLEEHSTGKAGGKFGICFNPEFLREGTAVFDYYNPPKTVIGSSDKESGDLLASIYERLEAPLIVTDLDTAEMVKYADNCWHALKVCFANEMGNVCKELGIDSHKVMDIFCKDEKLNLSPYYLKPGFAFGGSCLPKDVRAMSYKAKTLDLELPVLNNILRSNEYHIKRALRLVESKGSKKVGVLGFSFKAGTDDLRESPIVSLIELLIGKGYDIKLYDKNVNLAKLTGANKDYIMNQIPHISRLMVDSVNSIVSHADIVIIGNGSDEFDSVMSKVSGQQYVIDLVRLKEIDTAAENYEGICW